MSFSTDPADYFYLLKNPMKLINNTRVLDRVLEAVLLKAGRAVGARTAGVVVQVNSGRRRVHGMAYDCDLVRWRRGSRRWMATDGGAFRITLPTRRAGSEATAKATREFPAMFRALGHPFGGLSLTFQAWSSK